MSYRELIEWDRKRRTARPIVFGFDEADTGMKSTEEDRRVDW